MSESKVVKKRLTNFEVLRTLSMFLIVVWHSLVHGLYIVGGTNQLRPTVEWESTISVFNYLVTNYLMCITAVAVNCYILITGYFTIQSGFKWNKILNVWLQTSFYSFTIAGIMKLFGAVDWGLGGLLFSVFPIWNGEYWFVTKYLALIILVPYLSKLASSLSQQEYKVGLIILFALNIYLGPYLSYGNIYSGSNSLLWFIFLFYTGGYIRLYNPFVQHAGRFGYYFLLFAAIFSFINIAKNYIIHFIYQEETSPKLEWWLGNNSYTFFTAVLLFLWAKHYSFKESLLLRWIVRIAPFTFGIYLLHDNNHIRKLICGYLNLPQYQNSIWLIFILLGISLSIFTIGVLLDSIRSYVFHKFHLNDFFQRFIKRVIFQLKFLVK